MLYVDKKPDVFCNPSISMVFSRTPHNRKNQERGGYHMDYEVQHVKLEQEFKICPSCGYQDGFHSMFKKVDDITKWLFICPSCREVFDIGFTL
jgi:hypothetical protein